MEDPIHAPQDHAGFPALTGTKDQFDFRPRSPTTDEDLPLSSTSAAIVHIPDELSENDEAGSLRGSAYYDEPSFYDHGYNSSASSTEHSSASGVLAHYFEDDEPQPQRSSRTSSHSSVSSIPASVLVHPQDSNGKSLARRRDHRDSDGYWADHGSTSPRKSRSNRHREGPFRKPSSVRAIQMHTEDESDGHSTPSRRRVAAHRLSGFSTRSAGSSPLKRSHTQSSSQSASKKGVKNEYPLVLLHCTLLPPSLPVTGFAGRPDQKIIKDVLPRKYWRRWKLLEEKVGSGYLRDRGVLISHPEDSYDLLEEKLLESLELQRPRLHHGHFLAQEEEHESENEDMDREESAADDEQGDLCPDCGGRVVTCDSQSRKWEIKVFAANGLMRAGAWAAAWKEMEKVDIEVSLWLPTDIRRELERRLLEDGTASREEAKVQENKASPKSNPVDDTTGVPVSPKQSTGASQGHTQEKAPLTQDHKPDAQIDLPTLLVNYVRVLANDKRNIVIALLSIAIAFFAIGSARTSPSVPEVQTVPQESFGSASFSAASMSQYAAASARPSTSQVDDALESASMANSAPASVVSAADISAASEQDTASPEVEDANAAADVSELPDISMSTATATLLEVPVESMSTDDMPTEQPDAPAPTEYATEAVDSGIVQEPLESLESPVDGPMDPESDNLVDLDAAEPYREDSEPTDGEAYPDTKPDEATEPGIEEPTLEE